MDVTVLIDASTKGNQRLADLANRGLLDPKRILTPAHILGTSQADIEDLFAPAEYLQLFNAAFGTSFSEADIPGTDPITRRLARHLGHDFSHDRPATELLRNKIDILAKLGSDTLTRFERLFNAINATLSPPD